MERTTQRRIFVISSPAVCPGFYQVSRLALLKLPLSRPLNVCKWQKFQTIIDKLSLFGPRLYYLRKHDVKQQRNSWLAFSMYLLNSSKAVWCSASIFFTSAWYSMFYMEKKIYTRFDIRITVIPRKIKAVLLDRVMWKSNLNSCKIPHGFWIVDTVFFSLHLHLLPHFS